MEELKAFTTARSTVPGPPPDDPMVETIVVQPFGTSKSDESDAQQRTIARPAELVDDVLESGEERRLRLVPF